MGEYIFTRLLFYKLILLPSLYATGEYAPFGYVVDGYDLFLSLIPGDIFENTYVDDLGQLNLVKLRESSFSEVVQSSEQSYSEEPAKGGKANETAK